MCVKSALSPWHLQQFVAVLPAECNPVVSLLTLSSKNSSALMVELLFFKKKILVGALMLLMTAAQSLMRRWRRMQMRSSNQNSNVVEFGSCLFDFTLLLQNKSMQRCEGRWTGSYYGHQLLGSILKCSKNKMQLPYSRLPSNSPRSRTNCAAKTCAVLFICVMKPFRDLLNETPRPWWKLDGEWWSAKLAI